MPIRKYLEASITPEVARAMSEAFDLACRAAKERGLKNISNQAVAAKICELANSGETDPEQIAEMALAEILQRRDTATVPLRAIGC
jgi:hypothetical protein